MRKQIKKRIKTPGNLVKIMIKGRIRHQIKMTQKLSELQPCENGFKKWHQLKQLSGKRLT